MKVALLIGIGLGLLTISAALAMVVGFTCFALSKIGKMFSIGNTNIGLLAAEVAVKKEAQVERIGVRAITSINEAGPAKAARGWMQRDQKNRTPKG